MQGKVARTVLMVAALAIAVRPTLSATGPPGQGTRPAVLLAGSSPHGHVRGALRSRVPRE